MKKWVVRDRESGNIIELVDSVADGELLIRDYEQQDMDEGKIPYPTLTHQFLYGNCVKSEKYAT